MLTTKTEVKEAKLLKYFYINEGRIDEWEEDENIAVSYGEPKGDSGWTYYNWFPGFKVDYKNLIIVFLAGGITFLLLYMLETLNG